MAVHLGTCVLYATWCAARWVSMLLHVGATRVPHSRPRGWPLQTGTRLTGLAWQGTWATAQ
eukprot:6598219-Alexandrium_andersonii.AAC.1